MKTISIFLLIFIIIVSCSPSPETLTTPTAEVWAPTPEPTLTPEQLILSDVTGKIEAIDEHGNMVCTNLNEKPNWSKYEIEISIYQKGILVEKNIEAEEIDGKICFEMIDARYKVNQPVSIEFFAIKDQNIQQSLNPVEIGNYELVPFLNWFFADGGIGNKVSVPSHAHKDAYDFAPTDSAEFPNGIGHPVYLPSNGILITTEFGPDRTPEIHNMFFYLPDVGYYLQIGHTQWIFSTDEYKEYSPNTIIGNLTNETGWAHVHTTLRIPPSWNRIYYEGELKKYDSFIDMLNPEIQLGGEHLLCGFYICSTLPDIMVDKLDSGYFEPQYDSPKGEVIRLY